MCIKNASVHETLKIIERMAGRKNISFIKNDEPAFIKAFKQKVGYKEGPTVDSKREELKYEEDDRSDTEEEKPVVVVLKAGDLTAEEVERIQNEGTTTETQNDEAPADGKITFKKPVKRQSETDTDLNPSTVKKSKEEKKKKKSSCKEVKNSSLLSFDEDDEET